MKDKITWKFKVWNLKFMLAIDINICSVAHYHYQIDINIDKLLHWYDNDNFSFITITLNIHFDLLKKKKFWTKTNEWIPFSVTFFFVINLILCN